MEYTPAGFIRSEEDLNKLENLLKSDMAENSVTKAGGLSNELSSQNLTATTECNATVPTESATQSVGESLYKNIGKLVKVETAIGSGTQSKIGTLIDSGNDYITIKPNKNCLSIVIPLSSVKFITVVHDNNRQKLMNI